MVSLCSVTMEIRFKTFDALSISRMKKWFSVVLVASVFMLLVLRYGITKNTIGQNFLTIPIFNTTGINPLEWLDPGVPPAAQNPENASKVVSADIIVLSLFAKRNISNEEQNSLQTWNCLKDLINHAQGLPNAVDAIKEAGGAWNILVDSVDKQRLQNESSHGRAKEKQCPHFLNKMNATDLNSNIYKLRVPCGLTQGSAITIIGIPNGLLGNFRIDLTGEPLPGEPDPPNILHYNVRLHGDKITEDPVIVQNTWTIAHDWGEEERCPSPAPEKIKKGTDTFPIFFYLLST